MTQRMRIAAAQHACAPSREENLAKSRDFVRQAKAQGADVVALAELHAGPYFCQCQDTANFDLAEPIPGPTTDFLSEVAQENGVVIIGSLFEYRAPGLCHNTAVVLERDGRLVGRYRKMHIPDDPGFNEKFYFTPGDLGFAPIDTSAGRLGVLVCWDQWFPEAARLMTLRGAEVLIYPTAIGWDPRDTPDEQRRQCDAWTIVQRAHAVANGVPVVVANRVGFEPDPSGLLPGTQFWGNSFIAGPQGDFLAQCDDQNEELIVADLDPARAESVRRIWPFLRDRRIDAYSGLLERYGL